jgi:putative FmdB family regulatory protein
MPLYDFRCRACGSVFEALVRTTGPATAAPPCPACRAPEPERVLSAPVAPASYPATLASARAQARREGHFSHYSRQDRARA